MHYFHICITFIKRLAKFDYGFCLFNANQNSHKNGHHHLSVGAYQHSISVIYHQISFIFYICITCTFIKISLKFQYGFCQMNAYQDGQQNGCCLWFCPCGHSKSFIIQFLLNIIYCIHYFYQSFPQEKI